MRELEAQFGPQDGPKLLAALQSPGQPIHRRLLQRIQNLGLMEWDLWARGGQGVEQVVHDRPDATVLDISNFRHPEEPHAAALAIIDRLWRDRDSRVPILIVIDEAHNLVPAEPTTVLQQRLVDRFIQIAAEGRKYGLWLLLSTTTIEGAPAGAVPMRQPVPDEDELPADLAELGSYFGAIPADELNRAQDFGLGQALFAGGIATGGSTMVQLGERLTVEGGTDVQVPSTRASLT